MAEEFRLDPAGMQDMLGRLKSDNAEFSAAMDNLNRVLERFDGCWGHDKAGQMIAKGYVPSAKDVQKGVNDLSTGVGEMSDGVKDTVNDFRDLDEDNAKSFDHRLGEAIREKKNESGK
ncbi:hypothetical protein SD37_09625 [Amycolatopsis orientalis]|uniref:WXG100 family type VII secretion target n=1 Tax=Amycolatopsis orientalis TaxID=31958 RepID=A0A193BUI6_AMYOR|nr:hypothetical protein [Amycolatopsis orientalis]ANN15877.1 hypothetical protein SD37_09625 [Amycolatopsis orientalis]